MLNPAR